MELHVDVNLSLSSIKQILQHKLLAKERGHIKSTFIQSLGI